MLRDFAGPFEEPFVAFFTTSLDSEEKARLAAGF
jgi:hypothetical protein